jgi:hypothetical protein
VLSAEKTPTLCGTLPAFDGLIKMLQKFQRENISAYNIIQPGIEKLVAYQTAAADISAYIIATCDYFILFLLIV